MSNSIRTEDHSQRFRTFEIAKRTQLLSDLNDMEKFFISTWNKPDVGPDFKYRVYLAQKALNLNEVFFARFIATHCSSNPRLVDEMLQVREQTFLSQTGLILKAEEFATYYNVNQAFPRFLVVDELGLSGRGLSELFFYFEDSIISYLEEDKGRQLTERESIRVRNALTQAVSVRIFTQSSRGLLIDQELKKRVIPKYVVNTKMWFPLSQQITRFLLISPEVENTSYFPTFYLDTVDAEVMSKPINEWEGSFFQRYGETIDIYQKNYVRVREKVYAQQMIALHLYAKEKRISVTPYILSGTIRLNDEDKFLYYLSRLAKQFELNEIAAIFDIKRASFRPIQRQLLFSIASVDVFYTFIEESSIELPNHFSPKVNSDLDKVLQFFGGSKSVLRELYFVCESNDFREKLRCLLNHYLQTNSEVLYSSCEDRDKFDLDEAAFDCENFLIQKDIDNQRIHEIRRDHHVIYVPWSSFYEETQVGLNEFLGNFRLAKIPPSIRLACALFLIEFGSTGQRICAQDDEIIYMNVGESTLALLFLHEEELLPAVRRLEWWCRKNGFDTVRWAKKFGNYLDRYFGNLNACYTDRLSHFADTVYKLGLLIRYWPLNLEYDEEKQTLTGSYTAILNAFLDRYD